MSEIGIGELVSKTKKDSEGKIKLIGLMDGIFQCIVCLCSLRCLHPIKNIVTLLDFFSRGKKDKSFFLDHMSPGGG